MNFLAKNLHIENILKNLHIGLAKKKISFLYTPWKFFLFPPFYNHHPSFFSSNISNLLSIVK